jgi:hypothetical protein
MPKRWLFKQPLRPAMAIGFKGPHSTQHWNRALILAGLLKIHGHLTIIPLLIRTPPCVDLIIKHNLGRVVIAVLDPDNKVLYSFMKLPKKCQAIIHKSDLICENLSY